MLETLHDWVVHTVADYGLVAIFVLMLLESACIPIPSEVTSDRPSGLIAKPRSVVGPDVICSSAPDGNGSRHT